MTGIALNRILDLLAGDKLTAIDVATTADPCRVTGRDATFVGRRLKDLIGRIYADAPVPSAASESHSLSPSRKCPGSPACRRHRARQADPRLPTLTGWVDVDLAGVGGGVFVPGSLVPRPVEVGEPARSRK
ncbi:MAG: hypothetical protein ABI047_05720 [Jatrophihabitantaceae bacterium]